MYSITVNPSPTVNGKQESLHIKQLNPILQLDVIKSALSKPLFKLNVIAVLFFLRWSEDRRAVRFAGSGCVFCKLKQPKRKEADRLAGTQGHTCSK